MKDNGSHFTNKDRELITKLDVKVERLISDVADLRNNYATRITNLEVGKADKIDVTRLIDESAKTIQEETELKYDGVRKLVYGCVGAILLGFVGSIITLIYKQ